MKPRDSVGPVPYTKKKMLAAPKYVARLCSLELVANVGASKGRKMLILAVPEKCYGDDATTDLAFRPLGRNSGTLRSAGVFAPGTSPARWNGTLARFRPSAAPARTSVSFSGRLEGNRQ